ncbi:hypothetical protein L6R29_21065 [Myxococcota bacterium]|nr:hypothetical protein [Myxococcota bacterium]
MHDSDAARLKHSGLSGGFLENALKRMRVRQQMLVLATCFSRAVASEYIASLGREKSNFLPSTHGTMFRGENRVVFTPSDGNEVSLEPRNLGNGLYTHYFLKGLRGEADKNGDKCITAQEIQDYVSDKVSDEARKLGKTQTPSLRPDIAGKGMLLVRMPGCGQRVASTGTSGTSGATSSIEGWGVLVVSANVGGVKVYVMESPLAETAIVMADCKKSGGSLKRRKRSKRSGKRSGKREKRKSSRKAKEGRPQKTRKTTNGSLTLRKARKGQEKRVREK